jgi:polar amino acid transport system substrate-binding protein
MKIVFTILSTLFFNLNVFSATLDLTTSDFPPFQIQGEEKDEGMVIEIVREIVKTAGHQGSVNFFPWARAIQNAQNNPNTIIFSIGRNAEREKSFKWIGPVAKYNVYFWKLKERTDIKVKTIEDAKRYMVGGVIDDIRVEQLKKLGFVVNKNLELAPNDTLNIHKIFNKHIDIIPFDETVFSYKVTRAGHDFSKLEKMIKIKNLDMDLYIAASLNTPDAVVSDLKTALINFKKTKKYQQIKSKYHQH